MPFFRKISVILQNDPGTVQQKEARWTQLKTDSEKINYFFRVLKGHLFSKMVFIHCTLLAALNEFLHSEGHNRLSLLIETKHLNLLILKYSGLERLISSFHNR